MRTSVHLGYHGLHHPVPRRHPIKGHADGQGCKSYIKCVFSGWNTQGDPDGQRGFIYVQPDEAFMPNAADQAVVYCHLPPTDGRVSQTYDLLQKAPDAFPHQ